MHGFAPCLRACWSCAIFWIFFNRKIVFRPSLTLARTLDALVFSFFDAPFFLDALDACFPFWMRRSLYMMLFDAFFTFWMLLIFYMMLFDAFFSF